MSEAQHTIATLMAALAEARASAENGVSIDLGGLEPAMDEAMRLARAAPAAERDDLARAMAALIEELDRLAAALARQHHAGDQRRASAAYGEAANRSGGER